MYQWSKAKFWLHSKEHWKSVSWEKYFTNSLLGIAGGLKVAANSEHAKFIMFSSKIILLPKYGLSLPRTLTFIFSAHFLFKPRSCGIVLPHLLLILIAFCHPLGFSVHYSLKSCSFICVYCTSQSLISQSNSRALQSPFSRSVHFYSIDVAIFLLLQFIPKVRVPKSVFYRFFEDQDREAVAMWYLPLLSHLFTNQCQAPKFLHSLLYKKRNSVIQCQNGHKRWIWDAWIQAWHFWLRCQCRCLSSDLHLPLNTLNSKTKTKRRDQRKTA